VTTVVTNADGSITFNTVVESTGIDLRPWILVVILLAVLVGVVVWFVTRKKDPDSN
jgi:hypothetical protein